MPIQSWFENAQVVDGGAIVLPHLVGRDNPTSHAVNKFQNHKQ